MLASLTSFISKCFEVPPWILKSRIFVLLLGLFFLCVNFPLLLKTTHDPHARQWMMERDAAQYIRIADDFSKGDFQCRYVIQCPHRQMLYPLLLAPAAGLSGNDPFWMGSVNVWVGMVCALILYFGILRLYRNLAIAAVIGALFAGNLFIVQQVTSDLLTEPLHLLIVILAAFFFLDYVQQGKRTSLYIASGFVGLDYLTRTNGLFLMVAMMAMVMIHELGLAFHGADLTKWQRFCRLGSIVRTVSIAVLVFVLVTFPSWLPRIIYLHNPVDHGYLSNYMWVDSYNVGHTGKPYVSYTWHDYAATHGVMDVLSRWRRGFLRIIFDIPLGIERVPILYGFAVAGIGVAVAKRDKAHMLLAGMMAIQMLPLIWTNMSNPNQRVPYGALIPFEFFFAAFALDQLRLRLRAITQRQLPASSEQP